MSAGLACPCAAPVRLNGSAAAGAQCSAKAGRERICVECGAGSASVVSEAEFSGTACRMAFNNRRAKRGAELYDLFMALRHDRQTATVLKVWTLVSRLATIYRDEDRAERAGRRSWRHASEIIARRPYLRAEVLRQQPRNRD